jgi:hypothetical protein
MRTHIHVSFIHALCTFLEILLAWIPMKLVAARYASSSSLASAVLHVF